MVLAQRQTPYKGHGYVFLSPGVTSPDGGGFMHFGGGGEGVFYKGVGAGGEIGYAYPTSAFGCGIGLASVNGLFQFGEARPDRKVVPFATAGYSLAFRGDTARFVNFGGGATWWFRERTGLRLEFRDHTTDGVHLIGFRIGVSFR
jgi:hypothetical protein